MSVTGEAVPGEDTAPAPPSRGRPALAGVGLFTAATLVSAALLFAVQPMAAKMLLPVYGGSPMVWNTSVLFFQSALLAGYAYAHWSQRLGARRQPVVHIALLCLPLLALPIALPGWAEAPESAPTALWLLLVLAVMVGAPFAVLSTTGPLVQRWYSWSGLPRADDPYFLYAASNGGSLVALLAYPFLIEPLTDVPAQATGWTVGYAVFAVLMIVCALVVRRRGRTGPEPAGEPAAVAAEARPVDRWRRLRWLGLAFLPSSLMLGVTTHISTDIAPVPLMWVVPLALYLVTFIVAFGVRSLPGLPVLVTAAATCAAVLPVLFTTVGGRLPAYAVLLDLGLLVVAGLACHGLLAADRPEPRRLTEFFLIVSLGGALGGAFNGLLAPVVFDWVVELPLVVAALALLPFAVPRAPRRGTWATVVLLAGPLLVVLLWYVVGGLWAVVAGIAVGVVCCVLLTRTPGPFLLLVAVSVTLLFAVQQQAGELRERTFFGSYQISERDGRRTLAHGTTVHGFQLLDPAQRRTPTSYYARSGPLGEVFGAYGGTDRVAAVGLGAGTVAAYGRAGQRMDFYEIDPVVVRLARERFTFLRDSPAEVRTVVGDGRLRLAEVPDGTYGLIVLDAFSSDAVPAHLLTREAIGLYERKLRPGGVLAFHVSNRHLNLERMLGATARTAGMVALAGRSPDAPDAVGTSSHWVALARTENGLGPLRGGRLDWRPIPPGGPVWTDAHSSLFGVLRVAHPG
ncbi:hypothetical protein DPM19_15815 [Actinomadura craniellae]|uniref:Spermidine synthase n=1 Tax=Actinomadura craniellae TaxID=2231787 RepID=A0A365H829_9ACTN|nr:fused MFS/spermidine synthase [Actinomadura craniellae]RAY14423.1 hypothetical protein DPM19_15815 [Actinomadura craniellae]